ncbi:MAG: AraC family ligand binding domain-containing protein [Candidatus Synoicihabitans palmerolidicus]|nr:AraC family ligand binding domain-containing protein [Candidatus Synoicihabitans palmerolidicus]
MAEHVSKPRYFFRSGRQQDELKSRFNVMYGGVEECGTGYAVKRASFPFMAMEFVASGRGTLRLGERSYALEAGSWFVYALDVAGEIASEPAHHLVKYFVCFDGRDAEELLRKTGLLSGTFKSLGDLPPLRRLFEQLINEGRSLRRHSSRICTGLVQLLLLQVGQAAEGSAAQTFWRCRELID